MNVALNKANDFTDKSSAMARRVSAGLLFSALGDLYQRDGILKPKAQP
jgi:hypothetical protein